MNESTQPEAPRTLSSGIAGLDEILHGGLPVKNAYLLQGRPGTGKTTLALQFLLEGAEAGESALYVSFSESMRELCVVADSHGWDLEQLEVRELASSISERATAGASIFHAADVELPDVLDEIFGAIEELRPARVAIDSLTELYNMAESHRHFRRALFQLKVHLERCGATTIFVGEKGAADKTEAESIVHGVIELQRHTPEYGPPHRRLEVTKLRGRTFVTGYHDFKIETGGLKVFPRIRPKQHERRIGQGNRIASGIDELDTLLGGGLSRGTTSLVVGPSGVGKSSIVLQYFIAAAERGEHAVLYTFDEDIATIRTRANNLGMPLDAHLESGAIRIQSVDAAEMSPGQFADLVRSDVEHRDACFVAIDSINGYLHAMPAEPAIVPHLHDLLTFLGSRGILMMLVMTLGGLFRASREPAVHLSYLSDTVLLLRYFEEAGAVHKSITAAKHRTGAHENLIRELILSDEGIGLGDPLDRFSGVLDQTPTFEGRADTLSNTESHEPIKPSDVD